MLWWTGEQGFKEEVQTDQLETIHLSYLVNGIFLSEFMEKRTVTALVGNKVLDTVQFIFRNHSVKHSD